MNPHFLWMIWRLHLLHVLGFMTWQYIKSQTHNHSEFQLNHSRVSIESFKSVNWIIQEFQLNHWTVLAEWSKSFGWIIQGFQLKRPRISAESSKSFSWITQHFPTPSRIPSLFAESSKSVSWIIQEFQQNYPRVSAESSKSSNSIIQESGTCGKNLAGVKIWQIYSSRKLAGVNLSVNSHLRQKCVKFSRCFQVWHNAFTTP